MPPTIRHGSRGAEVRALQFQLNLDDPMHYLDTDGIFGPLTRARTLTFQQSRGLAVDGIVGPITWGALGKVKAAPSIDGSAAGANQYCGTCDPRNAQRGKALAGAVQAGALAGLVGSTKQSIAASHSTATSTVTIAGVTLTPLIGSTSETPARSAYGNSLHYDRIFLSDAKGLEGRAFAIVLPCPPQVVDSLPFGGSIQVLNIGTSPSLSTLKHELAHAWQSQHHHEAEAYLLNCLICQGAALEANAVIGLFDDSVRSHSRWPVSWPISAYASKPGGGLETYGGEQNAQHFELGESSIVSEMTGAAPGVPHVGNVASLLKAHVCVGDRRAPGVRQ